MIIYPKEAYCWKCKFSRIIKDKDGREWRCPVCADLPDDTFIGRHKINPMPSGVKEDCQD